MIITDYFTEPVESQIALVKQIGVDHGVIRIPENDGFDVVNYSHWKQLVDDYRKHGITPLVVEPLPNSIYESIKCGGKNRDQNIQKVIDMLKNMSKLNIRTLCLNFMAHIGWYRTDFDIRERGGALVTGFNIDHFSSVDTFSISSQQLWNNLEYFLKAVVPYAEKYDIRLALHPDDPPVPNLGGVSRILISADNMQRAIELVKSDHLGITLCQGSFRAMGEDIVEVIYRFGREGKIFFVHFRDIVGNRQCFRETFHDNGSTNMVNAIEAYLKLGLNIPVRVDHVPTMWGELNTTPGYAKLGRLFAIGYLKGILDSCNTFSNIESAK